MVMVGIVETEAVGMRLLEEFNGSAEPVKQE